MLLLFRRDCSVDYSVDKAAYRSHRRFQLMGNIRNKAASHSLKLYKRVGHLIERGGKLSYFIIACNRYSPRKISHCHCPRSLGHLLHRLRKPICHRI